MTPELQDRIVTRLVESGVTDTPWALIILAALEGEAQLTGYLEGAKTVSRPPLRARASMAQPVEPPGTYVSSITVEGFRGVGPSTTLTLKAGPGLSLVVGRNGSGKSSFAEGLEFLLTGRNYRWEKRSKVWCEGWRNLHQRDRVSLKAELLVEGQGPMTVARAWKELAVLKSETTVKRPGGKSQTLESMGWPDALVTFRPFLSYNELGSLLEEGPSRLYDALSSVLGLEELADIQVLLANARKARQLRVTQAREAADGIRDAIAKLSEVTSDRRLAEASQALKGPAWDTTALADLVRGESASDTSDLDLLARVQSLPVPDEQAIASVVERLRSTEQALAAFTGTNAERSRDRSRLLEQAFQFHAKHREADCPVCGTSGALSAEWAVAAREEIVRLTNEAAACEAADASSKAVIGEAQRFISAPPPVLAQAKDVGLSVIHEVRKHWLTWAEGRDISSADALANHLEHHVLKLAEGIRALIDEAQVERKRREDLWRPIAAAIAGWLPQANAAVHGKEFIAQLKSAEEWWKDATAAVRDERFTPIAERAVAVWAQLRLQSNVDLGSIELEGTAQRRRVALQVTVDGSPAEALGVMSQGELHSLALSLFLPRATLPESPFRFISIDDPVQSMDPARVEGLARVLAAAARTRQVIVFTHDDRLPEAVRRLGIPATVLSVTRRAQSIVDVRQTCDPISSLLDDARAVALTRGLPKAVAPRVVPGFCRLALEAACLDAIRRRRLKRGDGHDRVEELLGSNARTYPLMALALFDDEKKTEDVLARLKRMGPSAVETFKRCKAGAHEADGGDLSGLIKDTERLAQQISQL